MWSIQPVTPRRPPSPPTSPTGAYADLNYGSVAPSYIPQGNSTNVALNIHPTFFLTKQVDPISTVAGTTVLASDEVTLTFPHGHPRREYALYRNGWRL